MIKLFFVLFNILGVIAFNFKYDKVTISQEFPHNIAQGESFVVKLLIEKGQYNGYAKWQQELPRGFKAEMMDTKGGTFSFKDNVLKLIWLELPVEESFTITYKVVTENWIPKTNYSIEGKYSYIHENERKDILVSEESISVGAPEDSRLEMDIKQTVNNDLSQEQNNSKIDYIDFDRAENKHTELGLKQKNAVVAQRSTLAGHSKIIYKIQIAAGHNSVEKNHFSQMYEITKPVFTEHHLGWRKYTVGSYQSYSSAQEERNRIWASHENIQDAFITAYHSGKRISVQEALKISEEQWIK